MRIVRMDDEFAGPDATLRRAWLVTLIAALAACAQEARSPEPRATAYSGTPPVTYPLTGDIRRVHDPSIIKEGDTYYLFSTGYSATERIPIRCSKDLRHWSRCGDVLSRIPDWALREVPGVTNLWAPDISLFNGKYHLYYSVSTFGSNRSVIALATNRTLDALSPEYGWQDEGMIIQSRIQDDWNAIDPNIVLDEGGQPWLAFGSFWGGIKLRRVDLLTGKLSTAIRNCTPSQAARVGQTCLGQSKRRSSSAAADCIISSCPLISAARARRAHTRPWWVARSR